MATWKELRAQGIKRCCAEFRNRKTGKHRRCARRANEGGFWCDKHAFIGESVKQMNDAALAALNKKDDND